MVCGAACVNLQTDPSNCGSCGRACAAASNARAACAAGACGLVCNAGFGNCNGSAADGCETDTTTTLAHCGACGNSCPARANATARCSGGTCDFTCSAGYGDCNAVASDGCEVNLNTTNANCGRCGNVCSASQTCMSGVCVNTVSRCTSGTDPGGTGVPWVVCRADASSAWLSHGASGGGRLHAEEICRRLGYTRMGSIGGTWNYVCGYRNGGSCSSPGSETYDGAGDCGSDALGRILCNTVVWQCLR